MKKILSCLVVAVLLTGLMSSCLGPNNLFNGLTEWNKEVSEQFWVNELIFLGLNFIPVYGIFLFVDYVVLNTIDYWGGGSD